MIEEIYIGIYKIEIPLPNHPLQSVNSYLLKGKEKDLLIDTGMNNEECWIALSIALQELGADIENIDIFITHIHHDHFGLAMCLGSKGATIYLNILEATFLKNLHKHGKELLFAQMNGFPLEELPKALVGKDKFLNDIPLESLNKALQQNYSQYKPSEKGFFRFLSEGDTLKVGNYSLKCLMTPGHSSGHLCLYDAEHKILLSGDHILEDITPAIFLWPGEKRNPLKEYLNSLDKVSELEVTDILPGHRNVFQNLKGRIFEIKAHHKQRTEEMASLLDFNGKNAFQVASQASWNIPLTWDQFTSELKWMALAETLAHLKYMEEDGQIKSELQDDNVRYYYLK